MCDSNGYKIMDKEKSEEKKKFKIGGFSS
jgi:hypothetical protein